MENENYSSDEEEKDPDSLFERLDSFGASLIKTRAQAIASRLASGVETIWLEDEEYYEGFDNLNRPEASSSWRQKPVGQGNIAVRARKKKNRSTIFPNITAQFVDAGAARVADMLLPTDDPAFSLAPTPVPELLDLSNLPMREDGVEEAELIQGIFTGPGNEQIKTAKMEIGTAKKKADLAQKKDRRLARRMSMARRSSDCHRKFGKDWDWSVKRSGPFLQEQSDMGCWSGRGW